jgi:hypothetical protein
MTGPDRADNDGGDASPGDGGTRGVRPGEASPARSGAGQGGPTVAYYCDDGPEKGPILWRERDERRAIGVLGSPHDSQPIGTAVQVGKTEGGIAVWSIAIEGREVPGRWIVVGQEFLPKGGRGRLRR